VSYKAQIEATFDECEFYPPVGDEQVAEMVKKTGPLPEELLALLRETDGAQLGDLVRIFSIANHGGYTFEMIHEEWADPEYLDLHPNGSKLRMFASDGMGGFFGYEIRPQNHFGSIYHWDHETDELQEVTERGLAGLDRKSVV